MYLFVVFVIDVGVDDVVGLMFYLKVVIEVVEWVVCGEVDWVIFFCGMGFGVVIVVNKVFGICVVMVYDLFFVECLVFFNDVYIFCMG